GAAIACARAGLDVVVFERLPNREMSHHPDGGTLFSPPWITRMSVGAGRVEFPDLDISLDASVVERCEFLGCLGPDGLSTHSRFPKGVEGWVSNKDRFVKALVEEAERSGAVVRFGAKVVDVLKDGDRVSGVKLDGGEEVAARVVVCADGVLAKISRKAGFPVSRGDLWYAIVLAYEYDNAEGLPAGLFYILGDMQYEPDMPPAFAGVSIADVIHVMVVFLSRGKFYPADKPMDYYLDLVLERDERIRGVVGDAVLHREPKLLTGCRAVVRAECNRDVVIDGAVSVGDAWVDDGELGDVPSLANGVHAGRTIAGAAERNDFSKESLAEARGFISERLIRVLTKNKDMKLLPARVDEKDMKKLFLFMQHLNYPVLIFGSPLQQGLMLANFFVRNALRFVKYPHIARLL
ncbi:MAG TPA: FAD-dependent oxidoreductase, partial [Proteobacteria bacterium]|nr:FAD-dependent oxidoreductase [Pseudomonadota bacterium]